MPIFQKWVFELRSQFTEYLNMCSPFGCWCMKRETHGVEDWRRSWKKKRLVKRGSEDADEQMVNWVKEF